MKGIGGKLTASIVGLLLLACGTLGFFSFMNSSNALKNQVESGIENQAHDVSKYIEEYMARTFSEIQAMAARDEIRSMDIKQQFAYLEKITEKSKDYQTFAIVYEDQNSVFMNGEEIDLKGRAYVEQGFQGKTVFSDVLTSRLTGEPAIIAVTPIETLTGEKALLLAHIDGYYLSNITDTVKVGKSGFAIMLTADGTVLAHKNREWIKEHMNFIKNAKKTGTLLNEAVLMEQHVLAEQNGVANYESSSGGTRYIGFTTLENGWKIGVVALEEEALAALSHMKNSFYIIAFVVTIIGIVATFFIARSISRPIISIVETSEFLAKGDFTKEISLKHMARKDEVGMLAKSLHHMVDNMKCMIDKVNDSTSQVTIAAVELTNEVNTVNVMAQQIASAVEEVESGSAGQMAMAEESASSMEQMTQSIHNIAEASSNVVENIDFIKQKVDSGNEAVQQSVIQMSAIQQGTIKELEVIRLLEQESHQIGSISKIITDIADQTNLLALNASIEAARAGEAGKGFAVVAGEVRKLSEQTADSAAQINRLIDKVQNYTKEAVKEAVDGEKKVEQGIQLIETVGERFGEIVVSIVQITRALKNLRFL